MTLPFALQPSTGCKGFSLVELLVVISVIAILATVAIPNILNTSAQAGDTKNLRNAQTIASLAASARAAGYNTAWGSVSNAVAVLSANGGAGVSVTLGSGPAISLGLSGLSEEEISNAMPYLVCSTNTTPDAILFQP
jgi:type IV pilus assembly protein PilA